ncbi:hypothetical protein PRN20_04320 [Devosia sp. ZB163]|uniref:hypothetical protein n=1 Tax=Devosia sp. ZB163 TaxID=3025938 RepID=UPI0023608600|nr:hypothetical protein [Devosia sp. ZB163]MDC9822947.1 hypothetical protein [Devosia sp. ZB163]
MSDIAADGRLLGELVIERLLSSAPSFELALKMMRQPELALEVVTDVTLSKVIRMARSFDDALSTFEAFEHLIEVPVLSARSLLRSSHDHYKRRYVLFRMIEDEIPIKSKDLLSVYKTSPISEFSSLSSILLEKYSIRPSLSVVNYLIGRCRTANEVKSVIAAARNADISIDARYYARAVNCSRDFDEANGIISDMKKDGLLPTAAVFDALLRHVVTRELAVSIVSHMRDLGIHPTEHTYASLLEAEPHYAGARALFDEASVTGITATSVIYRPLIAKSPDDPTLWSLVDMMQSSDVTFSSAICKSIIRKCATYSIEKMLVRLMQVKRTISDDKLAAFADHVLRERSRIGA